MSLKSSTEIVILDNFDVPIPCFSVLPACCSTLLSTKLKFG